MPIHSINSFFSSIRNRHFFISDIILVSLTPYLALLIRYDWSTSLVVLDKSFFLISSIYICLKMGVFKSLNLYNRYWKSASIDDLALLILIGIYVGLLDIFVLGCFKILNFWTFLYFPFSFPFLDSTITFIFISLPRFSVRLFERAEQRFDSHSKSEIRTLIIGAGDAGVNTLIEIQRARGLGLYPIGFIDDDPVKKGLRIRGVSVFGDRTQITKIVSELNVKRILIAMPSVSGKDLREIVDLAKKTGVEVFSLPGLAEIIDGRVSIQKFRKIEIEDLLRRDPIVIDLVGIYQLLKGKVVLVTGAGGSIGREICRQVIKGNPAKLILLGHGENSIFEIEQELRNDYIHMVDKIVPVIADLRDSKRIDYVISLHKPSIVFHAAAHKHVPLMESNLVEAVTNNILGIRNILDCTIQNEVEQLVFISTDKAVNSTNVMGASKRVSELLIQERFSRSKTKLITVRFGNVLGSRGSVVHTFRKQISIGGPLTVTHPDIERYFMTIPEAVQLVLQAFRIGQGGEVFVLDMGERIKIVDLAKDMIRLSGLDESEIEIKFSGLREGEKMIEELFIDSENVEKTDHPKLFSAKLDYSSVSSCIPKVEELIKLAEENKETQVRELLFSLANCNGAKN